MTNEELTEEFVNQEDKDEFLSSKEPVDNSFGAESVSYLFQKSKHTSVPNDARACRSSPVFTHVPRASDLLPRLMLQSIAAANFEMKCVRVRLCFAPTWQKHRCSFLSRIFEKQRKI